jgi:hypothetical protein
MPIDNRGWRRVTRAEAWPLAIERLLCADVVVRLLAQASKRFFLFAPCTTSLTKAIRTTISHMLHTAALLTVLSETCESLEILVWLHIHVWIRYRRPRKALLTIGSI